MNVLIASGAPATVTAASPADVTLPGRLRAETRDLHDQIEANPRFARLTAPDLTREEFRHLVAMFYGHHAPAEEAIAGQRRHLPEAIELSRRLCRRATLAADLQTLGLDRCALEALPRCDVAALRSPEAAWGWLYVLEGSSLGGQVIARHVARVLQIGAGSGAGFLTPHGDETGRMWRDLKRLMAEAEAAGEIDGTSVVSAARDAFRSLDRWMGGPG